MISFFQFERNMICFGEFKLEKTHGNWKSVDTDLKIMYSWFTLHLSLSLVSMFILSRLTVLSILK